MEQNKFVSEKLYNYKEKSKNMLKQILLEVEFFRRKEENNFIFEQKQRLGEIIEKRDGSKFLNDWVDSNLILNLKNKLYNIKREIEILDNEKLNLKKKLNSKNKEKLINNLDNLNYNSEELNNDIINERIKEQKYFLKKEENSIKDELNNLYRERKNLSRLLRLNNEKINSRYGKLNFNNNEENFPILNQKYQILNLIGKGGFSEVYKAYDLENLKFVACKIHQLNPNWPENTKINYIKHVLRENEVHKTLCHENIASQYDIVEIDSHTFCTILEYCEDSDLYEYLKNKKYLTEKEALIIIKQILSALNFLKKNNKNIIHYDLKPQNILFHKGIAKITDFGLCKILSKEESKIELTSQGLGTYWYLPPECFNWGNKSFISEKVDIWSLGIIFFEILYGKKPFGNDMSQEQLVKEGIILRAKNFDFPSRPFISNEIKNFIKNCLKYNEEQRYSISEAYEKILKI